MFYEGTLTLPTDPAQTLSSLVWALMAFQFVTGMGSNAGITASLNGTAKSFPDVSVGLLFLTMYSTNPSQSEPR